MEKQSPNHDLYLKNLISDGSFPVSIKKDIPGADHASFHHHDFSSILLILKGSAIQDTNGYEYPITRGDLVLIPENSFYKYHNARDLEIYSLVFNNSIIENRSTELKKIVGYNLINQPYQDTNKLEQIAFKLHLTMEKQNLVKIVFEEMQEELSNKLPGWKIMFENKLSSLLVQITRWFLNKNSDSNEETDQIAKALSFMESNLHQNISIKEIAEQAFLSERHFSRLFQKSHGTSPHKFLLRMRMQKACSLLAQSKLPVMEIAIQCGFEDSNHFSKQFHNLMGISPSTYRNKIRLL